MRVLVILIASLVLSACGTGQFGSSYRGYVDPRGATDLAALPEEGEPTVIRSSNLDKDVRFYREHNYVVVGESAFNGLRESEGNAARKAKEVGATHVIIAARYTDTESHHGIDYQHFYRTYYVTDVIQVNGRSVVTRRPVTVSETVPVPYTRHYQNFDQWGVFLAKSNRDPGLGLLLRDLTSAERQNFKRNSGAFVDVVLTNSPAFLADIVTGDVIVAVNNTKINNTGHAISMINGLKSEGADITITVLKNGQQKNIGFGIVETTGNAVEPSITREGTLPLPMPLNPEPNAPEGGNEWINPDELQNEEAEPPMKETQSVTF